MVVLLVTSHIPRINLQHRTNKARIVYQRDSLCGEERTGDERAWHHSSYLHPNDIVCCADHEQHCHHPLVGHDGPKCSGLTSTLEVPHTKEGKAQKLKVYCNTKFAIFRSRSRVSLFTSIMAVDGVSCFWAISKDEAEGMHRALLFHIHTHMRWLLL